MVDSIYIIIDKIQCIHILTPLNSVNCPSCSIHYVVVYTIPYRLAMYKVKAKCFSFLQTCLPRNAEHIEHPLKMPRCQKRASGHHYNQETAA